MIRRKTIRQLASYVCGRSSVWAIISSSAQEVGPTWPLHCGYHLRTGGVEALNDACHLAWGIAVKTRATSARAAIWQTASRQPRYQI